MVSCEQMMGYFTSTITRNMHLNMGRGGTHPSHVITCNHMHALHTYTRICMYVLHMVKKEPHACTAEGGRGMSMEQYVMRTMIATDSTVRDTPSGRLHTQAADAFSWYRLSLLVTLPADDSHYYISLQTLANTTRWVCPLLTQHSIY